MNRRAKWFVVRTFVRERVVGRPRWRAEAYVPGIVGVEDRMVLLRRRTGTKHCVRDVLPFAEAYELDFPRPNGRPQDGDEVFSSIELCDRSESPARIVARKVGVRRPPLGAEMFSDGRLLRDIYRSVAERADSRQRARGRGKRKRAHRTRRRAWMPGHTGRRTFPRLPLRPKS